MMWNAAILMTYALLIGTLGALSLRRATWPARSPRLGVLTWQIMSISVLASVGLSGLVMLSPGHDAARDLSMFVTHLRQLTEGQFAHAIPVLWCVAFLVTAVTVAAVVFSSLSLAFIRARRDRADHLSHLALIGDADDDTGAVVVKHPVAAAYCLPGTHPTVVLTTAALDALDAHELAAVLAHEDAHLRGRHDLVLTGSGSLRKVLGVLPVFRWAHQEQAKLLEMVADDAAVKTASARTVASAMFQMADRSVRLPALGAGGSHTAERIDRLLRPADPLSRLQRCVVLGALATIAIAPLAFAFATPAAALPASCVAVTVHVA